MGAILALKAMPWRLIGMAALALFIAALMGALKIERAQNGKLKSQIERVTEARAADRAAYEAAQKLAETRNRAKVAEIELEQERITADATQSLSARLERLRRELRQTPSPAPGAAGRPGSPADGTTPGGTPGEAQVCIPTSKYVLGAEYEEKLDQWITWYERQLGVTR